jgi:intracellular multiplication protein IcmC
MPFNDLAGMIMTLGQSLPAVYYLVGAISYITGIILVAAALYRLRKTGDHQSHMVNPVGLGGPLANLLLAVGLIWWPTMLDTITTTFWGTNSPLGYTPPFANDYQGVWNVIVNIMKIVGLIAFIRGWYLLSRAGEQGQQGMIGKGLTHIVGGIFAYHIEGTLSVLMHTFGFNWG